jgi:PucR C-terminal helix-turn-helix domain
VRVGEVIAPHLSELADEIIVAIQREVPAYRRPLAGEFGEGIRRGTELALRRFVGAEWEDAQPVYRALGRGEHRAGRTLDALQAAYRVGARVAWNRMSEIAAAAGADEESQRELAGAMFAYIEEIAAESVEGYAEAQLARVSELERQRAALAAMIVGLPPPDPAEVARAAAAAGWRLPARVAALAADPAIGASLRRRLSVEVLATEAGGLACLLVADRPGILEECKAAAERVGAAVALGPTVPLPMAGRSWRLAELAHRLAGRASTLIVAEARITDLAMLAAADILRVLEETVLAPLEAETPNSSRRLEETLRCWLALKGSQSSVAAALGVHPQTVRYRLARLRELFGAALEDPERRFDLELALRSRQLAGRDTAA